MFGNQCVVPVEMNAESWYVSNWFYPMTTEQLLSSRIRQLIRREEDLIVATKKLEKSRLDSKRYFDEHKVLRKHRLIVGDLVLLYESHLDKQMSRKFVNLWTGPYVILEVNTNNTYKIGQFDDNANEEVAGNRLKLFKMRQTIIEGANDDIIPVDVELLVSNSIESGHLSRSI
jgi:hypothetical protein